MEVDVAGGSRLTVLPFDKVQIADIPHRTREIITIGALPPNAHARGSATT
jgi:hypothetical protein